ncbi:hypothetical protein, partial [Aeromonas enteropelogenes]|uniref:hypothetical protein n=1 Tax=Aeromonas enteropelogenes TaxID=29489 RepID=UPI003BA06910
PGTTAGAPPWYSPPITDSWPARRLDGHRFAGDQKPLQGLCRATLACWRVRFDEKMPNLNAQPCLRPKLRMRNFP